MSSKLPLLYSFRRCPYAIRARLALHIADITFETHEVDLKHKPVSLLQASPKGTVPVLCLHDGSVLDESLDMMLWALGKNDPQAWLNADEDITKQLIQENDSSFKYALDRYKYAIRFPEKSMQDYRQQAEVFLKKLSQHVQQTPYLLGKQPRLADMAICPFVRQCAFVDKTWFDKTYPTLNLWLNNIIKGDLFQQVMQKKKPAAENIT
ncbi:MAG: glutathione S-transferase [Mariprofundaceae bacterium]|nr:glutathione S-transferase [Mariprofundaceae bacterium]